MAGMDLDLLERAESDEKRESLLDKAAQILAAQASKTRSKKSINKAKQRLQRFHKCIREEGWDEAKALRSATEDIKVASRHFAKKQLQWMHFLSSACPHSLVLEGPSYENQPQKEANGNKERERKRKRSPAGKEKDTERNSNLTMSTIVHPMGEDGILSMPTETWLQFTMQHLLSHPYYTDRQRQRPSAGQASISVSTSTK